MHASSCVARKLKKERRVINSFNSGTLLEPVVLTAVLGFMEEHTETQNIHVALQKIKEEHTSESRFSTDSPSKYKPLLTCDI